MAEIGRTEQPNPAKPPPTTDDPNRRQDGARVNQNPNRIEGEAESPKSDEQRRQEQQQKDDDAKDNVRR